MERLQKIIARSGIASRRKAEELIKQGRVKVNGEVIKELGYKAKVKDKVLVDDKPITSEEYVYYVLNKPASYLSSVTDDRKRRVVVDLINTDKRIFPVGRLDYDTTGTILLTNDGELTNKLIHPRNHIEKEYRATLNKHFDKRDKKKLQTGVDIGGYITKPANVVQVRNDKTGKSHVTIVISEGKYHQVKKMFQAIGYEVLKLNRNRFGVITHTGLKRGEYRLLKPYEIKQLKHNVKKNT